MLLDRLRLQINPLKVRKHKLDIRAIAIDPDSPTPAVDDRSGAQIANLAVRMAKARSKGRPVMLTYGAHLIKNGLAPMLVRLVKEGWVTHLATNGAGSIHDWEFAYLGLSTEDVRANTAKGEFGTWDETGRYTSLAVALGGLEQIGYGWSMGKMIAEDGLRVPSEDDILSELDRIAADCAADERVGAWADLLYLVRAFRLPAGWQHIDHPCKEYSIQLAAYEHRVPLTIHPGIGYDIIYTHPMSCGGAIGRGALWDFLSFAESVSRLEDGVHMTVGSAIMAPMVFEKSMSMANNLAMQRIGQPISGHYLAVVDIQNGGDWDWEKGEPPMDNPAYYLRFCKSFNRMGGTLDYICLDNRAFLLNLYHELEHFKLAIENQPKKSHDAREGQHS